MGTMLVRTRVRERSLLVAGPSPRFSMAREFAHTCGVHNSGGIVEGRWKGLVWHDERVGGGRITRE